MCISHLVNTCYIPNCAWDTSCESMCVSHKCLDKQNCCIFAFAKKTEAQRNGTTFGCSAALGARAQIWAEVFQLQLLPLCHLPSLPPWLFRQGPGWTCESRSLRSIPVSLGRDPTLSPDSKAVTEWLFQTHFNYKHSVKHHLVDVQHRTSLERTHQHRQGCEARALWPSSTSRNLFYKQLPHLGNNRCMWLLTAALFIQARGLGVT